MITTNVSVILPTLNERDNIILLVNTINRVFHPKEIIIVDDKSTDGTIEIVRKNLHKIRNLKLIINFPVVGLTKSIQKGINSAGGEYIAWMDADFSHPPHVLKSMLREMYKADIVSASWLITGGQDKRNMFLEVIRSMVVNNICQLVFGNRITAYTSGYAMARKSIFSHFQLRGYYGEYFIDFMVRNQLEKRKIIEVPYISVSRRKGKSKTCPNLPTFIGKGILYIYMILSLIPLQFGHLIYKRLTRNESAVTTS